MAPLIEKVLRSALQNANYLSGEQGLDVDVDNLYVRMAVANDGPRLKRIRPAPMGRAFRYQRRTSHIVITIAEQTDDGGERHGKPTATKVGRAAKPAAKAAPRKRAAAKA